MSNISILLFFFGLKTTMYQPTPVSQGWILSQQTAAKCLLSPWKQLYVTSGASIYVTFYKNSLKVGCSVCWIISNVRSLDEKDIYENRCSVCYVCWRQKKWVGERSGIYLLLLAGWTGWSDPVWLMPVRVTPSDGFFFSRLLRVRFKSTDQSW